MPYSPESAAESSEAAIEREAKQVGFHAAVDAGSLVLTFWPSPTNRLFDKEQSLEIFEKEEGVGNYATIADKKSEALIVGRIKDSHFLREHRILAEESEEKKGTSEYQWIIDPIDGTPPFRHGLPEFGISIGLRKGNEPILGIIALPAFQQVISAKKGEGVFLMDFNGTVLTDLTERHRQDTAFELKKALVGYDLGYENRGRQLTNRIARLSDKIGYPVSYGSSSTANFRLAEGMLDAYFCEQPTKFDIGAASAIISELGGKVTDINGEPIDWEAEKVSYLAARTPDIHSQVLELLNG